MKKKTYQYFFLLTALFFDGCMSNFYVPSSGSLLKSTMSGKWVPTEDSISYLKNEHVCCEDKPIMLLLSENNSFSLSNMSECWKNAFGECKNGIISIKGTWSIYQRENLDNWLHLRVDDPAPGYIYAIPIIQRKGRTEIVFAFGDPDRGREIYLTIQ